MNPATTGAIPAPIKPNVEMRIRLNNITHTA